MTARSRVIWLTIRHSGFLTSIPVLIAYLAMPIVYVSSVYRCTNEELLEKVVYFIEILLPINGIIWPIAYLQTWIDSECEETLRACRQGSHMCISDLIILNIIYFIMLIPVFLVFQLLKLNLWAEYLRVLVQILFLSGVLYLIVVLLRSVAMGSMLITAYHLFCIFFSGHGDLRQFCLIRPNINAEKDTLPYLVIIVVAVTTYITSAVIEHTFYKNRI